MAASDVADLLLRIDATTEGLRRELKKAEDQVAGATGKMDAQVSKVDSRFEKLGQGVQKAGLAIAAAMAAAGVAVGAMVRNSINSADAASKQAQAIGVTVEALTGLQYAAELAGVSNENLNSSLGRFNRVIGDAEQGMTKQKQAFDDLGISIRGANGEIKSADKLLLEVSDRFSKYEDGANKSAVAQELFGRSGAALIPLLNQGADGITELTDQAAKLGLVLDSETARAAEQFNDSLTTLSAVGKGVGNTLMRDMLPTLNSITGLMLDYAENSDIATTASKALDNILKSLVTVGISISAVFEAAGSRLGALAAAFMAAVKGDFKGALSIVNDANQESLRIGEDTVSRLRKLWSGEYEKAGAAAVDTTDEVKESFERMGDAVGDAEKELKELNAQLERSLDRLYPGRQAVRELQAEYRLLEDALKRGLIAQQDFDNWLEKNVLAEVTVTAKRHVEELTAQAEPMATAYKRGIERMRDGIGDFFQRMIVDGKASFGDLLDLFKKMIAEMIATAAANRIMVGLGLSGASMAASAGGAAAGLGGLAGMGGSLIGGITSAGSALGFGAQTGAAVGGIGQLGASVAGLFGAGGIGAGAAFLVGGGVVLAGAALATKLLGSVFGSSGNKRAGVGINTGTGMIDAFGKGGNLGPAEEIGQALQAFSQAIGGSGSMLEIAIGNKSGIQLNGKKFADSASLINAALDEILDTSWHLAPVVKDRAKAFSGSLEATAAYAQAMQGIWQMANQNPVRMAMQDMESANTTVMQAYRDQVSAISQLVANFDGSAGAAQNLNAALAQNQQFAYQLAVAIRQVSGQLDSMFSGSAQAIRESAMTEEERLASMQEQRRSVLQSINELYDPAEINAAAREFDRLNNAIFEMAGRPSGQAEAFAAYAERANEVAQTQLDRVLKSIETSQAEQNRDIRNGMLEAATSQQQAANTMMEAANIIASAAYSFRSTGGQEVVI